MLLGLPVLFNTAVVLSSLLVFVFTAPELEVVGTLVVAVEASDFVLLLLLLFWLAVVVTGLGLTDSATPAILVGLVFPLAEICEHCVITMTKHMYTENQSLVCLAIILFIVSSSLTTAPQCNPKSSTSVYYHQWNRQKCTPPVHFHFSQSIKLLFQFRFSTCELLSILSKNIYHQPY